MTGDGAHLVVQGNIKRLIKKNVVSEVYIFHWIMIGGRVKESLFS